MRRDERRASVLSSVLGLISAPIRRYQVWSGMIIAVVGATAVLAIVTAVIVTVVIGCGGTSSPPPSGSRIGPALSAAMTAADKARSPWRCGARSGPTAPDETLVVGAKRWKVTGQTAKLEGTAPITIGAIADAGAATPATIAALERLQTKLARADVIIALGGMGSTQADLEATLGAISKPGQAPVIALPGDLEAVTAQGAAIAALRSRNQLVLDGRIVRQLDLPEVTVAIVAGASHSQRLSAGADGCSYQPEDIVAAGAALVSLPTMRVLATAEAPRAIHGGEPTGDLVVMPAARTIDIALHGPVTVDASSAVSGRRAGNAVAITPGTSDAMIRFPGPRHVPSAGLLTVRGGAWTWQPVTASE
ncbi:MAG: hypothetical protein AB7O24_31540 [Kofleriaceae bacterium]